MIDHYFDRAKKNSLAFYKNKMSYKAKQFNFIFPLHPYFSEMIGDKKEVVIADIGAGMFSTTGSTWGIVKVTLYPSDILADDYNKLLEEKGVVPIIKVLKEDMTELSYEDNFFDIVNCVNALDHCIDPLTAIQEMYRVCKPDGFIYLRHFNNNAEYEGYSGFHAWNISKVIGADDCLIWNTIEQFLLSDYFADFKVSIKNDIDDRDMIVTIIHKESE